MLRRSRGARGPACGSTSNARILDFGKESANVVLLYIFRQSFNRSYHTMSGLRVVLASLTDQKVLLMVRLDVSS